MVDILHAILIDASPEIVYNAITQEGGLKSWWTTDVKAEQKEGTVSVFGFYNHSVVFKMQIDELSNATWSDSNESYVPGRLDFLLYSIGKLQIARSFVLDTHDLAPKWLNHHNLKATDTSLASDHLPLVADIQLAQ